MPAISSLEPEVRAALRSRLLALSGVRRVIMDEAGGSICILCEQESERTPLYLSARNALLEMGLDPVQVPIEVAVPVGRSDRQRVRFQSVERVPSGEAYLKVRVVLEWQGEPYAGEAEGERGAAIELRTAARAALRAIEALTGSEAGLRLIGIKQFRAFDAELTVASIQGAGNPPQQYVGAVLAPSDPLRAAAIAVLNALNRMLGNYLFTSD